ncbi:MAG TPA: hypothetical protein EYP53_07125 [Candidatus Latescibacteria bacterium]|nr:hypothetical protein [Candidatus Latescibacterota bacterium]
MNVSSDLIGKRVSHPVFGEGVVEGVRWSNSYLQVRFSRRVTIWLPSSHVEFRRKEDRPVPKRVRLPEPKRLVGDRIKARRMIEAFRHGIVPHRDIEDFTFGRDEELGEVERCFEELEGRGGSALIVEGAYGAGKTHFLDYIYELATKRGYLVAKAELDGWEVTPAKPWRVYRELTKSMRFEGGGFRELLTEASRLEPLDPPHTFLTPALRKIRKGKADPLLWEWIAGERNPRFYLNEYGSYWRLPVLLTHSTASDIYSYILSGIGYLARRIGLKGFVVLLDEAETVFWLWRDQEKGLGFLKGLIYLTLNYPRLTEKGGGRDLGLYHSGVRTTPYLYKIPSYVFLMAAFTPVWSFAYRQIKDLAANRVIPLSGLTLENYYQMFESLIVLYQSAYPEARLNHGLDYVFQLLINREDEGVRFFLKASVEALDLIRHHPQENLLNMLRYG